MVAAVNKYGFEFNILKINVVVSWENKFNFQWLTYFMNKWIRLTVFSIENKDLVSTVCTCVCYTTDKWSWGYAIQSRKPKHYSVQLEFLYDKDNCAFLQKSELYLENRKMVSTLKATLFFLCDEPWFRCQRGIYCILWLAVYE